MKTKALHLNSAEQVLRFVQETEKLDADLRLISDGKVVNAKSLIAVLTIDFSQTVLLEVTGDNASRQMVWRTIHDYI